MIMIFLTATVTLTDCLLVTLQGEHNLKFVKTLILIGGFLLVFCFV